MSKETNVKTEFSADMKTTKERTYVVKDGDTLRSIAADQLGDPSRAVEIKILNKLPTDILRIGKVLKLPKKK